MTDHAPDAIARLEALEILVAHQERTIAELNDVITAHWRKIDALERLVAQLRNEVQNITPQREAPEPPPPHY
jgi:SlyX protein